MRQWESTITRLIKEAAQRRAAERPNGISRVAHQYSSPVVRVTNAATHNVGDSPVFPTSDSAYSQPPSAISMSYSTRSSRSTTPYTPGPPGYPPHDGFDAENDDDENDEYSSHSTPYPPTSSGRGTPMGSRRPTTHSMPGDREPANVYDRPRAQTESTDGPTIAQWRNNLPGPPAGQSPSIRPHGSRMNSNTSTNSYVSDVSFGNGVGPSKAPPTRPTLRSQFSSSRLKAGYDASSPVATSPPNMFPPQDYRGARSTTPSLAHQPPSNSRSRSASQPSAYVPKAMPPPPLPQTNNAHWTGRVLPNGVNGVANKRGSGSSQSTGGDSSDYSPNSSSPITPFASSESSLGGVAIAGSRYDVGVNGYGQAMGMGAVDPPVKVKVHFHEDIFVIAVPKNTEYEELVEKVGRKIRLCGPRRDDGPLRVKYKDEDGDMVSLGSTEDVQMAFEQYRPGGQVTLFVT